MDHRELAGRFNARFARQGPVLVGGADEPLYLPPRGRSPALIRYTRDHAQSVLHEIAHWCLAGRRRRGRVDYGFWYQPPPRSEADQARFYAAEVGVQALEMLLAEVSGVRFHFSADNPGGDGGAARRVFEGRVRGHWVELRHRVLHGPAPAAEIAAVLDALNARWHERLAVPAARCDR